MSLANLSSILKIFGGGEPSEAERKELFSEVLMLTLSRATDSDTDIHPIEVATVISIMERETGATVSAADVRVAAASEIYESAPLDQYLGRVTRNLSPRERGRVLRCLAEVITSDVRISPRETDFFNWIARALNATPAELAGMFADE